MSVPPGKTTFTLSEAAEVLSCHRETLRRAIRNGELQAAKLGRGFRISRSDLEAFWTACGGGDLFGREAGQSPGPVLERKSGKRPGRPKKSREMQFVLPGTEPVGEAEGDAAPGGSERTDSARRGSRVLPEKPE